MHHAERVRHFTQGPEEITVHFCSPFPLYPQKALSVVMNEHNEESSAKIEKKDRPRHP